MNQRILSRLKVIYLNEPKERERTEELARIISLDKQTLQQRAGFLIDEKSPCFLSAERQVC